MFYPSSLPRKPEVKFRVSRETYQSSLLPVSVPLAEKDVVFVASRQKIYALTPEGETVWQKDFYDMYNRFVESYALGKHLYVGTSPTGGGGSAAVVVALSKDSGKEVWRAEIGEAGGKVTSNMVVFDGKVRAGTVDGIISCFTESGEKLWERKVDGIVRGLAYGEGSLFVTTENGKRLYALSPSSGEELWSYEAEGTLTTPLYVQGMVITSSYGKVMALKDGKLLWARNAGVRSDSSGNSYIATSGKQIFAVSWNKLTVFDLKGNAVGNFTLPEGEEPGIPLASEDVVVLPTKSPNAAKIYLLWRGQFLLDSFKVLESDEVWMPSVSAAYGSIYVAVRVPDMVYRLGDEEKPEIGEINVEFASGSLKIQTTVKDAQSGIYRVLLFYTQNSEWVSKDMQLSRRYVMEPIGGYGLEEEQYEAEIPIGGKVEIFVAAIDNAGNYAVSEIRAYAVE